MVFHGLHPEYLSTIKINLFDTFDHSRRCILNRSQNVDLSVFMGKKALFSVPLVLTLSLSLSQKDVFVLFHVYESLPACMYFMCVHSLWWPEDFVGFL